MLVFQLIVRITIKCQVLIVSLSLIKIAILIKLLSLDTLEILLLAMNHLLLFFPEINYTAEKLFRAISLEDPNKIPIHTLAFLSSFTIM